jgi:hypothetical protein
MSGLDTLHILRRQVVSQHGCVKDCIENLFMVLRTQVTCPSFKGSVRDDVKVEVLAVDEFDDMPVITDALDRYDLNFHVTS